MCRNATSVITGISNMADCDKLACQRRGIVYKAQWLRRAVTHCRHGIMSKAQQLRRAVAHRCVGGTALCLSWLHIFRLSFKIKTISCIHHLSCIDEWYLKFTNFYITRILNISHWHDSIVSFITFIWKIHNTNQPGFLSYQGHVSSTIDFTALPSSFPFI